MAETEIKILELVRRIRDEQYERTKKMSLEELLQYFRREAAAADEEAQELLERQKSARTP